MTIKTKSGDTFDLIAFEYLGNCKYTADLMAANPDKLEYFIFPAEVELTLPEIKTTTTTNFQLLPSWYST